MYIEVVSEGWAGAWQPWQEHDKSIVAPSNYKISRPKLLSLSLVLSSNQRAMDYIGALSQFGDCDNSDVILDLTWPHSDTWWHCTGQWNISDCHTDHTNQHCHYTLSNPGEFCQRKERAKTILIPWSDVTKWKMICQFGKIILHHFVTQSSQFQKSRWP